jgi:hypothetical protein
MPAEKLATIVDSLTPEEQAAVRDIPNYCAAWLSDLLPEHRGRHFR